jgi:predicted esterase
MFQTWWFYYAEPLKGYIERTPDMKNKNIITMHGRLDAVIPVNGGVDGWG